MFSSRNRTRKLKHIKKKYSDSPKEDSHITKKEGGGGGVSVIKVMLLCERCCSYVARASLKLTVDSQSRMNDRV